MGMRRYDHRLIEHVQSTGDVGVALRAGIPRSTAHGWRHQRPVEVEGAGLFQEDIAALETRVSLMERRVRRLRALLRLAFALLHVVRPNLSRARVSADNKLRLLGAVDRSRDVIGVGRALRFLGLSASRLSAWQAKARGCDLKDQDCCPGVRPQRLTASEVATIRELALDPSNRHIPTGRLAVLAQRMGKVFASASRWYRLIRQHGWRRPRKRLHPGKPSDGIRAEQPNALWHIDMTVVRLLDTTKVYVHAVIDNFSRRILAWRALARFDTGITADLIVEASQHLPSGGPVPELLADGGVENFNGHVDALVAEGVLTRTLAQVDISYSNSLIEAWWRQLKHQWLFLNDLDSLTSVKRLVGFYVDQHNTHIPHAAFDGRTPDEVYFGHGDAVPEELAEARKRAREARIEANRRSSCSRCA